MSSLIYKIVTDRILAALDAGTVPWRKPWAVTVGADGLRALVLPRNLSSGATYRGANLCLLGSAPFTCPYWLTFRQALNEGGAVRKGEKGTPVVFWKRNQYDAKNAAGESETRPGMVLKYYTVFNATQCDGIETPQPVASPVVNPSSTPLIGTIPAAEAIVEGMALKPAIIDGKGCAFYSPTYDHVGMPDRQSFVSAPEWYSALFHELAHSTAHKSRVGRVLGEGFGTDAYAKEELIAEMASGYLCALAGISDHTIANAASYIDGWRKRIKSDGKIIVQAAGHAQRAAEYIAGTSAPVASVESEAVATV